MFRVADEDLLIRQFLLADCEQRSPDIFYNASRKSGKCSPAGLPNGGHREIHQGKNYNPDFALDISEEFFRLEDQRELFHGTISAERKSCSCI